MFSDDAGAAQGLRVTTSVNVPAASLSAAFANVGVTDDTAPTAGDLDGSGSTFSATALASVGVTPGGTVSHAGHTFTWPSRHPDNVVAAGQGFHVTGTGTTLGFLVTSTYGASTGTGQLVYTDGTVQPFTIAAPDWFNPGTAPDIVATAPYRNRPTGRDPHPVSIYYAAVPLDPTRTLTMVILPTISPATPQPRVPSLPLFPVPLG